MLFYMGLGGMFGMVICVGRVSPGGMGVVRRLFVISGLVMLGGFCMVLRGVGMMFGSMLVMICSFFGHCVIPLRKLDTSTTSLGEPRDSSATSSRLRGRVGVSGCLV
jgi:hypothetical protein